MTQFETTVCNMAEDKTSGEIEALISELQMIAERKYQEEEKTNPVYSLPGFGEPLAILKNLSIYKRA